MQLLHYHVDLFGELILARKVDPINQVNYVGTTGGDKEQSNLSTAMELGCLSSTRDAFILAY